MKIKPQRHRDAEQKRVKSLMKNVLVYSFAFLCVSVSLWFLTESLSHAADIKVVPSSAQVTPGGTFYIDVVVDNIPSGGLGAIQFRLNVNAQGSSVVSVSDTGQATSDAVSVASPLLIGPPTSSRSGIGDFFWNAAGPNGILAIDNEQFNNGSALFTFGHTSGAILPQGGGTVARFLCAVGAGVVADKIDIAL